MKYKRTIVSVIFRAEDFSHYKCLCGAVFRIKQRRKWVENLPEAQSVHYFDFTPSWKEIEQHLSISRLRTGVYSQLDFRHTLLSEMQDVAP